MPAETVIRVENLAARFGGRTIFERVGFEVRRGEVFVILGGSGCGKSTLLKHMIGLYPPAEGRIEILGEDIAALEGAAVTTIEGLSQGRSHPVQQAWLAEQVTQCGFCEPGFIMAIAALLQASPRPSREQVEALPNRCACGAQPRILRAIARASGVVAEAVAPVAKLER